MSRGWFIRLPFDVGIDIWHDGLDGFAPPVVLRRRPYLRFCRVPGTRYYVSVGRLPL